MNYRTTRELLAFYDIKLKKSLGQNFLVDEHVISKIISAAELSKDDHVIEIGTGLGSLTEPLCKEAGKVTAVEIDSRLTEIVEKNLSEFNNLTVINNDILKLDLLQLADNEYKNQKVAANLPYYISSQILMRLLECGCFSIIVVMMQKEVAERICAMPGTKSYGSLSIAVQYYSETELVARVPQNCFIPRPDIDSAVVKLTRIPPKYDVDPELLFRLIRIGFSHRRKTLVNCMQNGGIPKEQAVRLLTDAGLDLNIRGEALVLGDYARLAEMYEGK